MKIKLVLIYLVSLISYYMKAQEASLSVDMEETEILNQRIWKIMADKTTFKQNVEQNFIISVIEKTEGGYNAIVNQRLGDFTIDGGMTILMLNNEHQLSYFYHNNIETPSIKVPNDVDMVKAAKLAISNLEFSDSKIYSSDRVIENIDGRWRPVISIQTVSADAGLYLETTIDAFTHEIISVKDLATNLAYKREYRNDERLETQSRSMMLCDNLGNPTAFLNAKIHTIDPTTSPNNSSESVAKHTSGTNWVLGTNPPSVGGITISGGAPTTPENNFFCYLPETVNYNKLHAYFYTKDLKTNYSSTYFPAPGNLTINVNGGSGATVIGVGGLLSFGASPDFGDMAADRFHVAHGFIQNILKGITPNISGSALVGSCDYLVNSYYGVDGKCFNHGGLGGSGIPERFTDKTSYNSATSGQSGSQAQPWSSFLMRVEDGLGAVAGIGSDDTKHLLRDVLTTLISENIEENVIKFYLKAYESPSYISREELCRIREIIRQYFLGSGFLFEDIKVVKDYMMQDLSSDTGAEPFSEVSWQSPDIWNRTSQGSVGGHQNPEYELDDSGIQIPNYIYVQVKGRGCDVIENKQVHAYFSMASTGLSWPLHWQNYVLGGVTYGKELTGSPQAAQPQAYNVPEIYEFIWYPPNPDNFPGTTDAKHHVCLYARITDGAGIVTNAPETNPTFQELTTGNYNVGENTKNFNSIAWKNMTIIDKEGLVPPNPVLVLVVNTFPVGDPVLPEIWPNSDPVDIDFDVETPPVKPGIHEEGDNDPGFFTKGDVILELLPPLDRLWKPEGNGGGNEGTYQLLKPGMIKVLSPNFSLKNLALERGKQYRIKTRYIPKIDGGNSSFSLVQKSHGKVVGGETFQIFATQDGAANAGKDAQKRGIEALSDVSVIPNPSVGIFTVNCSESIGEVEKINVYDAQGRLVQTHLGKTLQYKYEIDINTQPDGNYNVEILTVTGKQINHNVIKIK